MKVRLVGTAEERIAALEALTARFVVTVPSNVYSARVPGEGRVYVEATLRAPATGDGAR